MGLTEQQILLLQQYRDRSYVMNVLLTKSYERFNLIKCLTNIPIIISSGILAVMNSSAFDGNEMKMPNIIINSMTAMTLSIIGNFKVTEREECFKTLSIKFLKLCHKIEDDYVNNLEDLTKENIKDNIDNYDNLIDNIEYAIPKDIQNKVKKMYYEKRYMPAFLNCEGQFTNRNSDLSVRLGSVV